MNIRCAVCGKEMDYRRPQYGLRVTVTEDMGNHDERRTLASMLCCGSACVAVEARRVAETQGDRRLAADG